MKKLSKKTLIFLLIVVSMFVLSGCQRNVDANGVTLAEKVISLSTPWKQAMEEGFLTAIFVWPLAQCINLVAQAFGSAILAVILVTIAFMLITLPLSIKSTVSTQKLQMLQPKMQEIQNKYAGKEDEHSKMMQAQEMQALYNKNNINPLGAMITPFLQFPILIAMFYAVQRADSVVNGTFAGLPLSTTPKAAFANISQGWPLVIVFILMIVCQFLSTKIPAWAAEASRKKRKDYRGYKDAGNAQNSQTNMMMITMVLMVGFIGLSWPIAMSFYWLINSLSNAVKTVFIQWRYVDHE